MRRTGREIGVLRTVGARAALVAGVVCALGVGLDSAVSAEDLSISASNRKIRAVTHGNGVWERTLLSSTVVPPDEPNAPESLILYQNYPNPFNPDTNIPFDLSEPAFVRASLINVRGQTVRTLATARFPAGRNEIRWDGKDQAGRELAGGVYICELKTEHQIETKRMTLLR